MFVRRLEQYFNFGVTLRMVGMVKDEIIYTFNSKSLKSHVCFFIHKVSIMYFDFKCYKIQEGPRALGCSPENVCS